jgi:hypothetical protein
VTTTLLDADEFTKGAWGGSPEHRRHRLDLLRCKTPGPVREGLWAQVLAYDLIRYAVLTSRPS